MSGVAMSLPRRVPLLPLLLLAVIIADALLWRAGPGLSLGLFALGLAALVLARARERGWKPWALVAMLLASALQSAVDINGANLLLLGVLPLMLLGQAHFPALAGMPARLVASWHALLLSWSDWISLGRVLGRTHWRGGGSVVRAARVALPALALALPFALLLGGGNAVLGEWLVGISGHILAMFAGIDFHPVRAMFWVFMALLAMALLHPAWPPRWLGARRVREMPNWQRPDARLARGQSMAALLLLNALFLAANTIDAIFLWFSLSLPAGVTFAAFVHEGTGRLILATLLSAAVVIAIFQQPAEVTRPPAVRALALAWIAQNLLLLGSVALRLWLYVQAYQLSELRVYLSLFLLLVAVGFGLLAWHVARGLGLRRLILGNAVCAFGLCFLVQFIDVPGLVANTNVRLWQESLSAGRARPIDLPYLVRLGPSAWPALTVVLNETRAPDAAAAARRLLGWAAHRMRLGVKTRDWRSAQLRTDRLRRELLASFPPPR